MKNILILILCLLLVLQSDLKAKKNKNKAESTSESAQDETLKKSKYSFKKKYFDFFNKKKNAGYKNGFLKIVEIESKSGKVECWYSGKKFDIDNNSFSKKFDKSEYYNCEHIWPQSKFGKAKSAGAKNDLHHIIPTDQKINSLRSSWPFGEATDKTSESVLKKNVFEVRDKFKGNIARAMFYFSVMYELPISDNEEIILREWNKTDPPDNFDKLRNDEIEKYQGNRNIFSDHPEYADFIEDF